MLVIICYSCFPIIISSAKSLCTSKLLHHVLQSNKLYIGLKINDDVQKNPMDKQTIKGKHL